MPNINKVVTSDKVSQIIIKLINSQIKTLNENACPIYDAAKESSNDKNN